MKKILILISIAFFIILAGAVWIASIIRQKRK